MSVTSRIRPVPRDRETPENSSLKGRMTTRAVYSGLFVLTTSDLPNVDNEKRVG